MTLLNIHEMERVGGQLGTNPAGLYQDSEKRRYYVKTLESAAHARNEYIAAQLYRLAGAPTFRYLLTTCSDQVATQWLELDKKCVAHFSEAERQQAQQWFGVHAWTANWDVAGFHGDNQGVAKGKALTLDVGGALQFRAQGDPKGKAFGEHVGELETLRTDKNNPHAMALFCDMAPAAIKQAVEVVLQIEDSEIQQTILENKGSQRLADKMVARKWNMAKQVEER